MNGNAKWVIGLLGSIAGLAVCGIVITEVSGHEPHIVLGYAVIACIAAISGILVHPATLAPLCERMSSFLCGTRPDRFERVSERVQVGGGGCAV